MSLHKAKQCKKKYCKFKCKNIISMLYSFFHHLLEVQINMLELLTLSFMPLKLSSIFSIFLFLCVTFPVIFPHLFSSLQILSQILSNLLLYLFFEFLLW